LVLPAPLSCKNYVINNNITVNSAVLLSDRKTVVLATSAHQSGVSYTIQVSGITDISVTPNVIASNSSLIYQTSTPSSDSTPPTITLASLVDATHLDIFFSEHSSQHLPPLPATTVLITAYR